MITQKRLEKVLSNPKARVGLKSMPENMTPTMQTDGEHPSLQDDRVVPVPLGLYLLRKHWDVQVASRACWGG